MPNYEAKLQRLFMSTIGGLKTAMRNTMKEKDMLLSPLYFVILKCIYGTDNCTAQSLAEMSKKDKGQITRLVKEVINQGLVTKHPNPADKRSQFLRLTDKGLEYFKELDSADQTIMKKMRAGISDEELSAFLQVGAKMAANLNALNKKRL